MGVGGSIPSTSSRTGEDISRDGGTQTTSSSRLNPLVNVILGANGISIFGESQANS
jgi:hypothetical protein